MQQNSEIDQQIWSIRVSAAQFEDLLESLERFLEQEKRMRSQKLREDLANCDEQENQEFAKSFIKACHEDKIVNAATHFPRLARYALFVNIMGAIEASVVVLCKEVEHELNIPFNTKANPVIVNGMDYLMSNLNIQRHKLSPFKHFQELMDNLQKVRNCIQHAEGDLRKWRPPSTEKKKGDDIKKVREFIRSFQTPPTISIAKGRIELRRNFIHNTTLHAWSSEMVLICEIVRIALKERFCSKATRY